jgi:amino acid adenylation domain-containing protein
MFKPLSAERGNLAPAIAAQPEDAPGSSTVWRRFFQCAARCPEAVALEWLDRSISYRELRTLVDRIADLMFIAPGAKPVIAVHGGTCPAFIAAMIAAMSRGAIVLPIDERLPELRKLQMIEQAGAALTITCSDAPLEPLRVTPWTCLDPEGAVRNGEPGRVCLSSPRGDLEDAAYLFFTSGTTGAPKGVLGRASSLDHFVAWQCSAFSFQPGDRIAPFTNLSFDPSLRDQFSMLCVGGALALPHAEARGSLQGTLMFIRRKAPTVLHIVPTLARHWLRMIVDHPSSFSSLRLTFFAGEPLFYDLVAAWRERAPTSAIVNLYGPTETTLARFYRVIPPFSESRAGPLAVGAPIPDTGFVILGEGDAVAAPGEPGEILIDTAFPSYGYLGEPGGGARFVAVPGLVPRFGKSFFRTGDLGVVDADGDLVVLGRLDSQLKISGVRVDPLEVVETLKTHPRVREACVGAPSATPSLLVAWYVPAEGRGEPPTPKELRAFLGERMIAAMVPSIFLAVPMLPTTSNGKIDRAALETLLREQRGKSITPPSTDAEAAILDIMRSVFGGPDLNCSRDFFSLGGDSLKAVEIALEIQRRFGVELAPSEIFENPSPPALASAVVMRLEEGDAATPAVEISTPPGSCSPVTGVHTLSTRQVAYMAVCMPSRDANWCILSRIAALSGRPSDESLRMAFVDLARRHDALRLEFPEVFRNGVQHFRDPAQCDPAALEIARFEFPDRDYADCQDEVMRIRADGSRMLFELSKWPLLRIAVLSFADISAAIVWAHHLVVDGPSLNILTEELSREIDGTASAKDAPSAAYLDYVRWCATETIGPRAEAARIYWRDLLEGFDQLTLPESEDPQAARGRLFTQPLPRSLVNDVLSTARRCGCTPFVVLLASYLRALAGKLGRSDVAAIIPVQIRPAAFNGVIGVFFSQLIVRPDKTKFSGDWRRELSAQIEAGRRHSGIEFHHRLAELGARVDGGHFPITTALFNQNRLAKTQSYGSATPFGHYDLGRDLRYQVQGEMQTMGDDFLIGYLYRKGAFPTHFSIEAFAAEVAEAAVAICREGLS